MLQAAQHTRPVAVIRDPPTTHAMPIALCTVTAVRVTELRAHDLPHVAELFSSSLHEVMEGEVCRYDSVLSSLAICRVYMGRRGLSDSLFMLSWSVSAQ